MTTTPKIIQEKYYAKLWIGVGDPSNTDFYDPVAKTEDPSNPGQYIPLVVKPQLGWFYIDAETGTFWIWDDTQWFNTGEIWTGGFL